MFPKSASAEDKHREERHPQAELLANQVRKALSGDGAHARGHFLNDDQRDRGGNQCPQQRVAVFRPGLRVSEYTARVVVDICRDEPRTYHGEQSEQAIAD